MSIGRRIKTIRQQRGLTIEELADKVGKNRTTIYRYENGDIENLPLGILDSLAEALDTTPAHIMGWESTGGTEYEIPAEMKYFSEWYNKYGHYRLTDEECMKVIEYTKFLVWSRDK